MTFIPVSSVFDAPLESEVRLRGWIYRHRSSGAIVFAVLRDQSGIVQVTVKKGNVPDDQLDAARACPWKHRWRSAAGCTRTAGLPAAGR